jgi:hypothetical protein
MSECKVVASVIPNLQLQTGALFYLYQPKTSFKQLLGADVVLSCHWPPFDPAATDPYQEILLVLVQTTQNVLELFHTLLQMESDQ